MAKKMVSPIMTWVFWGILVLGVFLLVTWEYFVAGFTADASKISYLIVAFFVYGFFASLRIAYYLQAEFRVLEAMESNQRISNANSSDAAALFDAALERIRRGDRIDIRNLVSSYGIRIKARVDNISVISSMLITIGLLGTVIGLIITVTGLGHVLSASGSDYAAMKSGLNQTVSGMGTAFYTTFFGALLGGVVLKVLGAEMKKSATQLVADTLRFSELFVVPQLSQNSSEALADLESKIVVLGGQLQQLGGSFSSVIDLIDSKQQSLASGLGELVAMVGESSRQANEHLIDLVDTVGQSIEQARQQAEAQLGAKASDLAQKLNEAASVLAALAVPEEKPANESPGE